ncbi:glycosyltransferase [Lederbergia wuyishanensis]|uniref:Spore maturation protein CgeB n=1 Tax=Lederbergia wuyishanensis TaxID=1347903 RepID=A0ABU0D6Y4_9BACI|nr:glycosyltransferase [Lederbergia wuyishanensis]MCJ8008852.1 glycosyltransferase [Lederbergia wuyishanensis]MDQ0344174.1 spore maturation protein CgeB [Lederbergia wuyishanensis]
MRILFLETHPMWIHGLPNGFKDLGHSIKLVNPNDEALLLSAIKQFQPNLIITIGWTDANDTLEKQSKIGHYTQSSGIPHIYWATEDPGYTESFTLPLIERAKPDMVFTICKEKLPFYQALGIEAGYMDFGYHSSTHFPVKPVRHYKSHAALVANGYPQLYEKMPDHLRFTSLVSLVDPILERKLSIFFYGRYWDEMKKIFINEVPSNYLKGYLHYTLANQVYSSADIVIGVQNKKFQVTQRTYEILASGGLLLATDTPAIREHFTPHRDLIVSSSAEETSNLLDFYFNKPEVMNKIKQNGIKAVERHSYTARAENMIKQLRNKQIIPWYID